MANYSSNRGRTSYRSIGSTQTNPTTVFDYTPHWATVLEGGEVHRLFPTVGAVIKADERQNATSKTYIGGSPVMDIDLTGKTTMTIHDIFNSIMALVPQGVDAEVWSRGSNGAKKDANRFSEGTDRLSMTLFHKVYVDVVISSDGKVLDEKATTEFGNVFFSVKTMVDEWVTSVTITRNYREFMDAVKAAI